jgi:type II secretory pathway pseudopilin PulG
VVISASAETSLREAFLHYINESSSVVLSIAGIFCSAAGSLIEKVAPEHRRGVRVALVVLAIIGFASTAVGTVQQTAQNSAQKQQIGPLMEAAQTAQEPSAQDIDVRLDEIQAELRPNASSGVENHETAAIPSKSERQEYYVQIAADASPEGLKAYAAKLQTAYNVSSSFTAVVEIPSAPNRYRLAFGQHLDKATAQRYMRIADSLGLCPGSQTASIEPQPK